MDVAASGDLNVLQTDVPDETKSKLSNLKASDAASLNKIVEIRNLIDQVKTSEKIDIKFSEEAEVERQNRVKMLNAALDNETLVLIFIFLYK